MNWVIGHLVNLHPSLANLHGGPLWVFLIVVGLTAIFLLGYLIKGLQVWWQLSAAVKGIKALRRPNNPPLPEDVAAILHWEPFKHIWEEYADTLHLMRKAATGASALIEVRATVPAESMFTRDVLVDSRLFDEFTRHLPGVLTGLGIIGTFAGLLTGLSTFDPSSPATAVSGLGPLMRGVEHAFVASGMAIACAMFVVFFSKLTLAYFYLLVERLNHAIDSLYSTGAGEEYLSRLVKASESSEAHTAQLKDALVEDLSKMMNNLVDRQIAAHETATKNLGERIGDSISTSLAEPMKKMGEAIEHTNKGNGEQVNGMLETLLTGFMAKLEDTFGGQMRGINEQMQKSMDVMTSVQGSLQGLLEDIKKTNEQATNQMSGKLEDAMKQATENQAVLTDQMREFVGEFRRLATEEQSKSKQAMDDAVMKVLGEVSLAMNALEVTRNISATEEKGRNDQLSQKTTELVGGLSGQVDSLVNAVSEQVAMTQKNIEVLQQVSLRAIDGMNQGALTMGTAASRFESAGNSVTTVFDKSSKMSDQLTSVASTLQLASLAVQKGFDQYDSTRRTVDTQVAALMGLIDSAKKEAGVSQELVASLKKSAESLREAESTSRTHLEQVNTALVKAFTDFGNAMVGQVKSTIAETDMHLSQGTGHLIAVVQELAIAVQRMRPN
jgi:hypothetical protein